MVFGSQVVRQLVEASDDPAASKVAGSEEYVWPSISHQSEPQ